MKPSGRPAAYKQSEAIDFVPKRDLDQAQQENERLRKENDRLQRSTERLQREAQRLQQETERRRRELEAALRASKRQAAPHSRGNPKANAKRPGRKSGRHYGRQACRPTPSRVDEQIAVPLPEHCPHCGGGGERKSCEYQEEIVRRTMVRRFDIAVGCCRNCQRRVQGRHPLQTSDAVGVGNVQLGPEALTLAAILNKQMGLSLGHTRQVLSYGFGLEVRRGGLYRALARMADRAEPTYDQLVKTARQAPVNGRDETGRKVGGRLQWLHVAVSAQATLYSARPRIRTVGRDSGCRIGCLPDPRRLGALLPICTRVPSKLSGPSAEALPGDGAGRSPAALAFPCAVEHLLGKERRRSGSRTSTQRVRRRARFASSNPPRFSRALPTNTR